jgi:anti-sigma regulatory factor (Ser/Thr protein kinase)
MHNSNWVRRFPREVAALDSIFAYVEEYLDQAGLDRDCAHDADLVLEELFTNFVRHNQGTQPIEIGIARQDGDLVLTMRDFDVEPFDPTRRDDRAALSGAIELQAGGRGIHLVKRITKEFRYEYADRTSTLTTRLGLTPAQEP